MVTFLFSPAEMKGNFSSGRNKRKEQEEKRKKKEKAFFPRTLQVLMGEKISERVILRNFFLRPV